MECLTFLWNGWLGWPVGKWNCRSCFLPNWSFFQSRDGFIRRKCQFYRTNAFHLHSGQSGLPVLTNGRSKLQLYVALQQQQSDPHAKWIHPRLKNLLSHNTCTHTTQLFQVPRLDWLPALRGNSFTLPWELIVRQLTLLSFLQRMSHLVGSHVKWKICVCCWRSCNELRLKHKEWLFT